MGVELTNGNIVLRRRTLDDVDAQINGQDESIIKWLDWDPPTPENVADMIVASDEAWDSGIRRFEFGIRNATTDDLIGNCLANCVDPLLAPGEVNLAYAVFSPWRGRGIAGQTVELFCEWLAKDPLCEVAILKIDLGNDASERVAYKHGFVQSGVIQTPKGMLNRFARNLR